VKPEDAAVIVVLEPALVVDHAKGLKPQEHR
jgi:hypothetical protein